MDLEVVATKSGLLRNSVNINKLKGGIRGGDPRNGSQIESKDLLGERARVDQEADGGRPNDRIARGAWAIDIYQTLLRKKKRPVLPQVFFLAWKLSPLKYHRLVN